VRLEDVPPLPEDRWPSNIGELDRVLGGGIVPGSLVLVGGDPGIGKSTLMLQAAQRLSAAGRTVLYVSGEESPQQTKLRADRVGACGHALWILAETDLDAILRAARQLHPSVLVVDSIQTVYRSDVPSSPGSVGQVRESAAALLQLAKAEGIATFLVGHVTKEGAIAGPRVLEHIVDTVLYFEGERHQSYRILRAIKNRFGSTNEIGVFEMRGSGLAEVPNPSALFLSQRPGDASGAAVVCAMEGTRPLLVEVQALVSPTAFGTPRRTTAGLDYNRLLLILAVLDKRAGLQLGGADVYVNAAGGVRVDEPAADLGVAAAIASSLRDRPLDPDTVFCGEIGLTGEIRGVPQLGRRLTEAAKLGFRRAIVPRQSLAGLPEAGVEVAGADTLLDALDRMP
jgi:DNA repair protein RadA/Sms